MYFWTPAGNFADWTSKMSGSLRTLSILKFDGIDNINDIEKYKGKDLWIPREEAQELGEDEYYIADLIRD